MLMGMVVQLHVGFGTPGYGCPAFGTPGDAQGTDTNTAQGKLTVFDFLV